MYEHLMEDKILDVLMSIEGEKQVKLLYACESGSRAWGFASPDSDYDVRFIYLHPIEWYLSVNLEHRPDVIEFPLRDGLDVGGWDLRKALKLFQRSNPPLLEWIGSPIVYCEPFSVVQRMRRLAPVCYSPVACMYHYFKMARGNYRDYLRGERVWLKKYLYVLRPVLAVIWLERDLGVVPTEFHRLVAGVVDSDEVRQAIDDLLQLKRYAQELEYGPKLPLINEFLDSELSRMEAQDFEKKVQRCPTEELDNVFRLALKEAWV